MLKRQCAGGIKFKIAFHKIIQFLRTGGILVYSTSMELAHQYLLEYLEEEFSRFPDVRVRVVPHREDFGVTVRTSAREYFFPMEWAACGSYEQVNELVGRIKSLIEK